MIHREITNKVLEYAASFPVVTITGPRQSGKTTLAKALFADKPYVSLEDLDVRRYAQDDPRGFLSQYPDGAVLDEAQRVPDLFSYIQTIVDTDGRSGHFIITGSQQFEMLSHISQSLAGRTALVRLLPFTLREAYGEQGMKTLSTVGLDEVLFTGFLPRIFDKQISPSDVNRFYTQTYLERDVRQLLQVRNLTQFEDFLYLCAGRTGQLVNLSAIGDELGLNHKTIKAWLSVLEASYIIKLVYPYHKRIARRVVKTPKLYFLDTGIVSYLLGIQTPEQIITHPQRGALFETMVVSEVLKQRWNKGLDDNLYFYRDQKGNEVDMVIEEGSSLRLIELKSSKTFNSSFLKGFSRFPREQYDITLESIIYSGTQTGPYKGIQLCNWKEIDSLL